MITAQDIREKCFEKARIGGYAMDEVDDFLDELANDAAASQKEIATLNAKMKYLADKIRETLVGGDGPKASSSALSTISSVVCNPAPLPIALSAIYRSLLPTTLLFVSSASL